MPHKKKHSAPLREMPGPYRRLWHSDGVALLELIFLPPEIACPPPVGDYYAEMLRCLCSHAEEVLSPRLTAQYTADPDPRKRYTHRRTVLWVTCHPTVEGDRLLIERRMTLSGAAGTRHAVICDCFSAVSGQLLSLRKKRKMRPRRHQKGGQNTAANKYGCYFNKKSI